ncbi:MAG: DUF1287 domain-containing protein [Candidatus Sulfomarinibacteraceae bacterium]
MRSILRARSFPVLVLTALVLCCRGGTALSDEIARIERVGEPPGFVDALTAAALERTRHAVRYDGAYRSIPYPGGDVPAGVGVCTDVLIRSYRALAIDLQEEVHEDMASSFSVYPRRWGLSAPDPNIDHRRVPNLEVFFTRHGERIPITGDPADYQPGDLVSWMVGPLPHIGIVVPVRSSDGKRFQVVHNIGRGPELEDMLFDYPIVGHFRYYGPEYSRRSDS